MTTELNKVQYVDQDFSSAVLATQNFISTNYPAEYNDYTASNLGMALIDIIAYAQQNLHWYMNRRVTDLYFPTAITPNAISKIARMLGYKPKGATGSVASITVTLSQIYTFPISISKGFQFKGPRNLVFEYQGTTPIVYLPGELIKTFDVREGSTSTINVIASGLNNQIFTLPNIPDGKFVEEGSVEVMVDGIDWPEYGIIPYENIPAFETNILSRPSFVKFGDGVQGTVPASGLGIRIKYGVVSGFNGRILRQSITEPLIPLVVQFQAIPLSIFQNVNSSGGDDPEEIKKTTTNAPRFQRTQDRAITKSDYDFLATTFPNVAKGDAITIRSISGDVTFNGFAAAINSDLQNIFNLGQSASGYQNVSGYVNSVSGNISSINSDISLINTNYQNVSGVVNSSSISLTSLHNSIQTQMTDLFAVAASSPAVITTVVNSVTASLAQLLTQVATLQGTSTEVSGFAPFPEFQPQSN
jgi:hypothetical protein